MTLNLWPEFPPMSAQKQVVGSSLAALSLNATLQQGSVVVTSGQESPAAKPKAQGCGPQRRPQRCRHWLAPLH